MLFFIKSEHNIIIHNKFDVNRKFAQTIPRDFGVRYNPYTQSIDILDSARQIRVLMREVHQEMELLLNAMDKL